jgi:hypothetical protein
MFGLVADAPLMRPAVSTITKAGKRSLGVAGSTISSCETALEPLRLEKNDRREQKVPAFTADDCLVR